MIPVARPSITDKEIAAVAEVMRSYWLGQGASVTQFEEKLKNITGANNIIAVSSGTMALRLALEAEGIGSGDTVLVPSLTFCATIQAITATGAYPIFCEVSPETLNIDLKDAAERILPSTRAIIPVHMGGLPCNMKDVAALAAKHNLTIIEDAAHAFGSSYGEYPVGGYPGSTACFSFDPIKNITCGEGGAIATDNDRLAEKLKRMRMLGIDRDSWSRRINNLSWFYEVTEQGHRAHMSNINAALGLSQLARMEEFRQRRVSAVERYNDAFGSMGGVATLKTDTVTTFPFSYTLRVLNSQRDKLITHLAGLGVDSGLNYIPNHLQPLWKGTASLPVTEKLYGEIITLPLYSDITDDEVETVIKAVKSFF